ncbi:MAG: hypothetical protein AVDCRST_MAG59-3793 [uncultured Thermomicrobiales bacterium]|uniref:Uncharacterized protein n=1 Tax=uncultured Thermomicrobiales bacterium TaxID=1645740 RepID=A0A6J4VF97_9BACT|nr:MAG: hypothetical protein AVDCRST_MAG59-3793 [uncultured Thermomicrobiales bacterium]
MNDVERKQQETAIEILGRYRSGLVPRREALRLLAGLGLGVVGLGAIGAGAFATRASTTAAGAPGQPGERPHGGKHGALLGQASGTPAAAMPQPGERPDGARL